MNANVTTEEGSACEVIVLAPGPGGTSVLANADGDRLLSLPTALVTGETTIPKVIAVLEARFAARAPVLRVDSFAYRNSDGEEASALLVEIEPSSAPAPEGLTFAAITPEAIKGIEPTFLREPLTRWLDRQRSGPSPRQAPWSRPGWLARASTWMYEEMARAGLPTTVPPRIHYMSALSAVLRAESAGSAFYLKCSALVFRTEAVLTAALAAVTPDLVTPVLTLEPEEGWLLMRDFGSQLIGQQPVAEWVRGLQVHATLQHTWSDRRPQLIEIGAQVRSLRALAVAVPGMAEHPVTTAHLSDEDRAAWHAATPGLVDACLRLDALGPPDTLVHGDLHPWNVVVHDGHPRVVDWSDTALGHPFVDLATYVFRTDDLDARRRLRDAYLAGWAGDLAPGALTEAGQLALVVGCLYQVDTYRNIVAALDPDDGPAMYAGDAIWLRRALAVQHAGIDYVRPKANV